MAAENLIIVSEQVTKMVKKVPVASFKEVKTDETPEGVKNAVDLLKKKRVSKFEIKNMEKRTKELFIRTISGKNYTSKTQKV